VLAPHGVEDVEFDQTRIAAEETLQLGDLVSCNAMSFSKVLRSVIGIKMSYAAAGGRDAPEMVIVSESIKLLF
jgi:hypothetical protein